MSVLQSEIIKMAGVVCCLIGMGPEGNWQVAVMFSSWSEHRIRLVIQPVKESINCFVDCKEL